MTAGHAATLLEAAPLSIAELAQAVGAEEAWILQLVEVEILELEAPGQPPSQWRFDSADLRRALAVRELERDFGANLDAAALILDLQQELRRLRVLLAAHGAA